MDKEEQPEVSEAEIKDLLLFIEKCSIEELLLFKEFILSLRNVQH